MDIIIFCMALTKTLMLLEVARDYWSEDFLEGLKRASAQKPRFVCFGDVNVIQGTKKGRLGITL